MKVMEKTNALEEQELLAMTTDCERYLLQALENYLRCLQVGDMADLKIFRIVSLWFDNCGCPEVNSLVERLSPSIPSHKFLPLYYQLAARMGKKRNKFLGLLTEVRSCGCLVRAVRVGRGHHYFLFLHLFIVC